MKKDICGRIARLALIAFALYGITFGALFLRGGGVLCAADCG